MALASGTKLGPYEILSPLGAGGMGEVYRARDTRLWRDVALKLLPLSYSSDPERLRRFEQEARAAGALNHPNILAVYDVGTHDSAPFLVAELLEGEVLSERLRGGPLPLRKAIEVAGQAARGAAAAHDKGIIHRDLKPANIFLTGDGSVKILDFGLAKLTQPEWTGDSKTPVATLTASPPTQSGAVLGTVGYMSPEQIRGKTADARSDIFALGVILYEMLAGQRPFEKESSADTMAAILHEDPPELSAESKKTPPAVERIVRHCLEKNPAERFQSARDLAFDLEALSDPSATGARLVATRSRAHKWLTPLAMTVALLTVVAVAVFFGYPSSKRAGGSASATFVPISFRSEAVFNARFAPDGTTVVFSAAAEGNVPQLFVRRNDYPAPQPMGLPGTQLLSISSKGELAVLTGARYIVLRVFSGTLARMDLGGGAPRDILENVQNADWSPDGSGLAIIREVDGMSRLEYPPGKVLFETAGYLSDLRFSPRGDQIAFFEHPFRYDNRGSIDVTDLQGHIRLLGKGYIGEEGLAWANDGGTVYFSGATGGRDYVIHAVTLSGKTRVVLSAVGALWVLDRDSRGNLLAAESTNESHLVALASGAKTERDLSWLDRSILPQFSANGQWLLFTDSSAATGLNYALLLRKTDGSPVVRLGEGRAAGISPDGAWALSMVPGPPMQLALYPMGAGERRVLEPGKVQNYESAQFFPDGKRVLACGNEPGHATRCYIQEVAGGAPHPSTPEGTGRGVVSPDAKAILAQGTGGKYSLYPVAGGSAREVPVLAAEDRIIRWSADGRSVLVFRNSAVPARIEAVDLLTGRRTFLREVAPADRAGVLRIREIAIADTGKSYAYSYYRSLSRLAIVEGVK